MKNIFITLIMLCLSVSLSWGQRSRDYMLSVGSNYSGEALNVFDLRDKGSALGNYYWNDDWAKGSIRLINGKSINERPIKYDLLSNGIEIKVEDDIKVLPGDLVEEFVITTKTEAGDELFRRFIRLDLFFDKDVIDRTFYELIQDGEKITLLVKTDTEVLEPNYVAILDAGNVQSKIVKKEKIMIFDGTNLIKLPKSKGRMLNILERYKAGTKDYYKETVSKQKGKHDHISDLKQLLTFINS